jgi:hypothetical protein
MTAFSLLLTINHSLNSHEIEFPSIAMGQQVLVARDCIKYGFVGEETDLCEAVDSFGDAV